MMLPLSFSVLNELLIEKGRRASCPAFGLKIPSITTHLENVILAKLGQIFLRKFLAANKKARKDRA